MKMKNNCETRFGKVQPWLLVNLSGTEAAIYTFMAMNAGKSGKSLVSQKGISEYFNFSKSLVSKAIKKLTDIGYIEKIHSQYGVTFKVYWDEKEPNFETRVSPQETKVSKSDQKGVAPQETKVSVQETHSAGNTSNDGAYSDPKEIIKNNKEYMSFSTTCSEEKRDLPYEKEENEINHSHEVKNDKGEFYQEVKEVYSYLSSKTGKSFSPDSKHSKHLRGRLREYGNDLTVEILKGIIDLKVSDWKGDSKMKQYLRPDTLFNAEKFEKYLDQYLDSPVKRTNNLSFRENIFTVEDLKKLSHLNDTDILIYDFLPTETGRQWGMTSLRQGRSEVKNIKSHIRKKTAVCQIIGYWDADKKMDVMFEKPANFKPSIIDNPETVESYLKAS